MTPDELFTDVAEGYRHSRHLAGLVIAEIDLLTALDVPGRGLKNFDEVLAKHPRKTQSGSRRLRTLSFDVASGNVSLRTCYNAVQDFFRVEHYRLDYPTMPGHATGAWDQHLPWLDALVTFDPSQLVDLRKKLVDLVLTSLSSHAFDPSTVRREPPLFAMVLESFPVAPPKGALKEPTGAVFQAMTFGFIRADNPHLQVETRKVREGSKRRRGIGDIDGWDGARLALSAEVKQFHINAATATSLLPFATEVAKRAAIGIVTALGFDDDARQKIADSGLRALDRNEMLGIVHLWDPIKQRIAVSSMSYHVEHVEAKAALIERFRAFLDAAEDSFKRPARRKK